MQRNSVPCGRVGLALGPSKQLHDHLKPCFLRWTFMKTEAGAHTLSLGVGGCTPCRWKCPLHYLCSWAVLLCPGLCLCLWMPGLSRLCSAMFCGQREKTSLPFGKANLRRRRRLVIWVAVGIWLNWRTEDCDQGGRRWLCGEGFGDAIQDSALESHLHRKCCFTLHW